MRSVHCNLSPPESVLQSELVAQAVYSMRWARTPLRFRRSLLVVMERARRPLRPAAGLVIPLSLETFIKVPDYILYFLNIP